MTLMKQRRSELEWPAWMGSRRLFDWPESWKEMLELSTIDVEEYVDEGHLVVRAELPGIDPDEDVEITISNNTLHIHAERRSEKSTEDKQGYRSEFQYGSFSRSIRLPAGATDADVTATYSDGILEVRIPIDNAEAKATTIPVTRG